MSESDDDDLYGPPLPPSMKVAKPLDQDKPSSSKAETARPCNTIGPVLPCQLEKTAVSSSDSESDSSSSTDSDTDDSSRKRRKRKHKKSKRKAERKEILHFSDQKKVIGPSMPPSFSESSGCDLNYGGDRLVGPMLPPNVRGRTSDSDDEIIGPALELQAREEDLSAVKEFESRSQKMKEKLTMVTKTADTAIAPTKRESWMTELPEEMGASFGLGNRQFRSKEAPEMDSSWTEAPHEKGQKQKESKKRKKDKEDHFQSSKDRKAAKQIEEYNKKNRPESLLEMHKKELKKKKKKEKKKNKDKPQERRPFDRDIDLKVNRFDNAQKQAFIKRSQELASRFKSGGTGTSFL